MTHLYRRSRAERREVRRQGGLSYRAIEVREQGLFIGEVRIDWDYWSEGMYEPPFSLNSDAGGGYAHRCACGAWFANRNLYRGETCIECRRKPPLSGSAHGPPSVQPTGPPREPSAPAVATIV